MFLCCNSDRFRSQNGEFVFSEMESMTAARKRQDSYSTATVAVRHRSRSKNESWHNRLAHQSDATTTGRQTALKTTSVNTSQIHSKKSQGNLEKSQNLSLNSQSLANLRNPNRMEMETQEQSQSNLFDGVMADSTKHVQSKSMFFMTQNVCGNFKQITNSNLQPYPSNGYNIGNTFDIIPEKPENMILEKGFSSGSFLELEDAI